MKKQFSLISCALSAFLVSSCAHHIPPEAYTNRGSPESLLDVSSEMVTVELLSSESIAEVQDWVESDQPSRAEIYCIEGDVLCDATEETLILYGIEYEWIPAQVSEVNLIYERVIAHDCENRFINNRINPYNLNYPTFGCSTASNMVQMVSDRRQFIAPSLLGFMDGPTAVKNVGRYRAFDSKEYFPEDLGVGDINFE